MAYTPTEWETADIVTATRMNALEQAVGEIAMSYTPNTWSDGDILTAAKMNALEQAVASGGGGGSSDFSTAEVTLNMTNYDAEYAGYFYSTEESFSAFYTDDGVTKNVYTEEASKTVTLILDTNGSAVVAGDFDEIISLSGDAEFDDPELKAAVIITGDCTINFAGYWFG